MLMNRVKLKAACVIMCALSGVAHAAAQGGYFGLMLGQSNLHSDKQQLSGTPSDTLQPKGNNLGLRLFLGYHMNPNWAVESGFTFYSPVNYTTTVLSNDMKTRVGTFEVVGKGVYPFAQTGWSVFGKLGAAYLNAKTTGGVSGYDLATPSASTLRPVMGVGVSYDLTQRWVADLSYTRLMYQSTAMKNPDFLALGISYHLVDERCGQFLC